MWIPACPSAVAVGPSTSQCEGLEPQRAPVQQPWIPVKSQCWGCAPSSSQCWGCGFQHVPVLGRCIPACPSTGAMAPSISQCQAHRSQRMPVPSPWVPVHSSPSQHGERETVTQRRRRLRGRWEPDAPWPRVDRTPRPPRPIAHGCSRLRGHHSPTPSPAPRLLALLSHPLPFPRMDTLGRALGRVLWDRKVSPSLRKEKHSALNPPRPSPRGRGWRGSRPDITWELEPEPQLHSAPGIFFFL